ncbi:MULTISPECIES: DapH/DapD/GlmU-related protein [unclassified Pseudofrankia]|uniref:acyltransferase n=1 Tax=unclassified Pseudofrankia TaxID=2994372 RepID=UPI0008D959D9|nr:MULTISPECIES: acyltransferase [unclassified Pseudofrankia]MDT3443498.1 acyltransferase [Pseudofrankia sp. BMG5.37]OHV42709.1 transferase [Pseudofrankia sp. BMG5.36]
MPSLTGSSSRDTRTRIRPAAPERLLDLWRRIRGKSFTLAIARTFAALGGHTMIEPPLRLHGARRIEIGSGVFIGPGSWLQVPNDLSASEEDVIVRIGDGCSFVGWATVSAVIGVTIGERVLFARGVYICDHDHEFQRAGIPIMDQGHRNLQPVSIGDGAWLGQNVVVLPGAQIGRGAVIAANSVVKDEIPDYSVAAGSPAKVIRSWSPTPS